MNADDLARLAANHLRNRQPKEAEALLRQATALAPGHAEANFLLGMILARTNRWQEAIEPLERVVQVQPRRDEALYWLAICHKNIGNPEASAVLCRQALAINPDNPIVLNELGVCCLMIGNATEAQTALQKACLLNPNSGTYQFNLGMAHSRLDQIHRALEAFQLSARLDPGRAESFLEIARLLELLNRRDEVLAVLTDATVQHPNHSQVRLALASANAAVGNSGEAETLYRRAVNEDPSIAGSFGLWLQKEGRFEESVVCFAQALQADPIQGLPYFGLAEAKVFELDGQPWHSQAEQVASSSELDLKCLTYISYALARSAERSADYEQAIRYYDQANDSAYRLYNLGRPFDKPSLKKLTDRTMERFGESAVRSQALGASRSAAPIFIVGMIRSGTTLLDQILSSHRDVSSAGEPVYWLREADRVRRMALDSLPEEVAVDLSVRYLEALRRAAGTSPRIIDKMPLNYAHLGLIHQVFPNAKIIHMRRQPLDTCFSIYTTFLGLGPIFSYNQDHIVFSFLEYMRLMEHWRQVLPKDRFIEVDYESLIADKEPVVRQLLEFCDLEWDEACLHHDRRSATISTPSKWQARQPIYRSSLERWRPYEPWLKELLYLKGITHPTLW